MPYKGRREVIVSCRLKIKLILSLGNHVNAPVVTGCTEGPVTPWKYI